jgi:hypothetical protein
MTDLTTAVVQKPGGISQKEKKMKTTNFLLGL